MASWKYLKTATLGTVTLGSSYTSGSGSMSLTAGQGARLPSAGDFWLAWSEDQSDPDAVIHLWKVTARSTDTLTVTAETTEGGGDTNVSSGETLRAVMSISALDQLRQDISQTGSFASAASEKAGNLYWPNNSFYALRDSGSAMAPWGPIFPMTQPVDGNFAWVNQGGASVATTNGGVFLSAPATAGNSLRIRKKTAPATPWTATAHFIPLMHYSTNPFCGICVRESSTGKVITFTIGELSGGQFTISLINWTNETTFSSYTFQQQPNVNLGPDFCYLVNDNGTNLIWSFSNDGINPIVLSSLSRTAFMAGGPDEVGFFCNAGNASNNAGLTLLSWKET